MFTRLCLVAAVAAVSGCETRRLTSVPADLELTPARLDFGDGFVGYPRKLPVTLRSMSRRDFALELRTLPPFSVEPTAVRVPAGGALQVQVTFDAAAVGDAAGALMVSGVDFDGEIPLSGRAAMPLACQGASQCQLETFDPALGVCVSSSAPDGAACASACVQNPHCTAGACVGTAIDCADADACTVDACDPARGCVHLPRSCPTSTDPCQVPRCDPALGCAFEPAADGTACGPRDCTQAQVCLNGQCSTLAVPNGAACGQASACQAAGTCQQQVCVRPAKTPLIEEWHIDLPQGPSSFRGVVDSFDRLYWVECDEAVGACSACSATSQGAVRFRRPLSGPVPTQGRSPLHLLVGGQLVVALETWVLALDAATGNPLWSVNLEPVPDGSERPVITALSSDGTSLWLLGRFTGEDVLLKLSAATGAVLFSRYFGGTVREPVLDEAGNVYVYFYPTYTVGNPSVPVLLSLSPSGMERWRKLAFVGSGYVPPVAAYAGTVLLAEGQSCSAADGTLLAGASLDTHRASNPVMSTNRFVVPYVSDMPVFDSVRLRASPTAPGLLPWDRLLTSDHALLSVSDALAVEGGGLMLATAHSRFPAMLRVLEASGAERYSCEVPQGQVLSASALVDGRWVVLDSGWPNRKQLRAFRVAGEKLAARGWVNRRGDPEGSGKPRR